MNRELKFRARKHLPKSRTTKKGGERMIKKSVMIRIRYNPETDKYEYYYIENGKVVKV